MPTFASFSSILLVMSALSGQNPGMQSPLKRSDCELLDIVMYYEDKSLQIEDEPIIEDIEVDDEDYLWDYEDRVPQDKNLRSKDANT